MMFPVQTFRETPDHIMWIFSGEWSILDNFALTPVEVDVGHGLLTYRTSEHAFQAAKSSNRAGHDAVRRAATPGLAKALGQRVRMWPDWDTVRFPRMRLILAAKHRQHAAFREALAATGSRPIYEGNTWADEVWGVVQQPDGRWRGRNALGEMLMELR